MTTQQQHTTSTRGGFLLGQKLRQAATRVFQVLSQEKHAMSSDSDDDASQDALRFALEWSVEQQLRNGYVLDPSFWNGASEEPHVNPTTSIEDDCFVDPEDAAAIAEALRVEARLLREAQDTEYARALAQDQMLERSQQQREAWRKLHRRMRKQRLIALQARVLSEPADGQQQAASSLVLRFPDGCRAERRFRAIDRLADVHTYIEALMLEEELKKAKRAGSSNDDSDVASEVQMQRELSADEDVEAIMEDDDDEEGEDEKKRSRFHLVSSYPRRRLDDLSLTLQEAGLCPNGVLFVQPNAGDDGTADLL
jgi:hypothetical protein